MVRDSVGPLEIPSFCLLLDSEKVAMGDTERQRVLRTRNARDSLVDVSAKLAILARL
jgi:hypothetical protein